MRLVVFGWVLVLAACAPQSHGYPDWSGKYMSAAEKKVCRANIGKPISLGPAHAEYCEYRYVDGGKKCTDSNQCEGKCLSRTLNADSDEAVVGQCQRVYPDPGCSIEVIDGRTHEMICIH